VVRLNLRWIALLWLALLAPGVSLAQYGLYGDRGRHEIEEADIRYLARKASLTEDQTEAALNLFSGYNAQMSVARRKMEDFQRDFFDQHGRRLSPKSPEWERAMQVYRDFGTFQKRQRERLLEDLRSVLTPGQDAGWEALQRHLRRRSTLSTSMSPIGSIDLVSLATSAAGNEPLSAEASACLDQYEIELDRALASLEKAASETEERAAEFLVDAERLSHVEQAAIWAELSKPVFEASKAVRDINLRYAERIGSVLSGERSARFESWFHARVDADHSETGDGPRAFEDARKAAGLTAEQTGAIDAVEADYLRESRQIARETIRLTVEREDAGRNPWEFEDDETYRERVTTLQERRNALTEASLDRLRSILTAEQLEAMDPPLKRVVIEYPRFGEE